MQLFLLHSVEGAPEIGERLGPPPCGRDVANPIEIHLSPTCVILPNLVLLGQTVLVLLRILVSRLSRSLKVIGTDTYWSATYDFLLTSRSNHGLSRTFSEIDDDFSPKSKFHPRVFCPHSPLNQIKSHLFVSVACMLHSAYSWNKCNENNKWYNKITMNEWIFK